MSADTGLSAWHAEPRVIQPGSAEGEAELTENLERNSETSGELALDNTGPRSTRQHPLCGPLYFNDVMGTVGQKSSVGNATDAIISSRKSAPTTPRVDKSPVVAGYRDPPLLVYRELSRLRHRSGRRAKPVFRWA